ncbi:hypothetical protein B0T16DRAFT_459383 [Cercophora newfieldiana]|uniref:Uncharacterized protein n=1 Tax=Cercophora newfieldiana TaxID=92897 RepID=A0AA39Y1N3_9PEZI|nr:hypothetical protein B0T16DRAFT_459383 [Cercophora newfieldiana]
MFTRADKPGVQWGRQGRDQMQPNTTPGPTTGSCNNGPGAILQDDIQRHLQPVASIDTQN